MRFQQLRVFQNFHRQPIRDDETLIHDDCARKQLFHQRHIVSRDQYRDGQAAQEVVESPPRVV